MDWGDGDYSRTAAVLAPVARVVADAARIGPQDTVLDVGCGTGNFALCAAERGARVTAVDPADVLLAHAGERVAQAGHHVDFLRGSAANLPCPDASFDVVASVFALIFDPDPERSLSEAVRVARPGGRVVITSWVAEGALHGASVALWSVLPAEPRDPPRWDEPTWVVEAFANAGLGDVRIERRTLMFTAQSPAAWFEEQERFHPIWRWMRRQVTDDRWRQVRNETIAAFVAANQDADALAVPGDYLIISATTQ